MVGSVLCVERVWFDFVWFKFGFGSVLCVERVWFDFVVAVNVFGSILLCCYVLENFMFLMFLIFCVMLVLIWKK